LLNPRASNALTLLVSRWESCISCLLSLSNLDRETRRKPEWPGKADWLNKKKGEGDCTRPVTDVYPGTMYLLSGFLLISKNNIPSLFIKEEKFPNFLQQN